MSAEAAPRPQYHCPRCGSSALWDFDCHTYGDTKTGFRACLPCDSATRWFCASDTCHWTYTQGLNPRNPRTAHNEASRPQWLPERGPHEWPDPMPLGGPDDEDESDLMSELVRISQGPHPTHDSDHPKEAPDA